MALLYRQITAALMANRAYHRYEVWRDHEFIGEAFQFAPDVDTATPMWLAQSPDGLIHGWLTHIWTRKAAGAVLAKYADRPARRREAT